MTCPAVELLELLITFLSARRKLAGGSHFRDRIATRYYQNPRQLVVKTSEETFRFEKSGPASRGGFGRRQ
jgi:hypothetical protein